MQTLEGLRTRVETAEDLLSVVRIMKAVSAVSIRQYQEAVESVRTYSQNLEFGFQVLLRHRSGGLAGLDALQPGPVGRIVFGSDQGMCGPFNERMSAFVTQSDPPAGSESREAFTIAVGHRLAGHLNMARVPLQATYALPGSASEIAPAVNRLLLHVERWRHDEGISEISVSYHRLLSGASYQPRERRILPIDVDWLEALRQSPWPSNRLPTYSMSHDELLSMLVRQYIFIELFRAFAESLASENASRLAAMQVAERNIEERLDALRTRYHAFRQQSITQELLDIVSGFIATTEQ